MRGLINYIIVLTLAACTNQHTSNGNFTVEHYGMLREIMMEQKMQSRIDLSTLKQVENLYALGAMDELRGEILIIDGQPVNSRANDGSLTIDTSFNSGAALLVKTEVKEWKVIEVDLDVSGLKQLENRIAALADQNEIDVDLPFPFQIIGTANRLEWHVINAADATERNHDAYKEAGLSGTEIQSEVQILGFYSNQHEGVFTHHGSYIHLHFVNQDRTKMGHVDELEFNGPIQLLLPKNSDQ